MESVTSAIRFLAVSQIVLLFVALASSHNPTRVRLSGAALAIGVICYLLGSAAKGSADIQIAAVLFHFASLTPLFMLLFVWLGFEEQHNLPGWVWLVIGIYVSCEAITHIHYGRTNTTHFLAVPMQIIQICLALTTIFVLWKGREHDLVEGRNTLRTCAIYCTSGLILVISSVMLITQYKIPQEVDLAFMSAVFILSLTMNVAILKLNPAAQISTHGKPKIVESQDKQISELLERMESERLYADHDLRVAKLASLMGLPEHRLRKKINQQLGYRNFNQFVNHYRIEEAGDRLHKEPTTPILSLALDVGFRSISSFNTAFQLQYRMSPTEYRQQALSA